MASIQKRPSGRYQVQIKHKGMKVISRTFNTKKAAEQFAREVEKDTEIARAIGRPTTPTPTLSEVVDLYIRDYPGRDTSYKHRAEFWQEQFGQKLMTQLSIDDVDDGLSILKKRNLTGSTINRYHSQISSICGFFMQHEEFKKIARTTKFENPALSKTIKKQRENEQRQKFLSLPQQERLLQAAKNSHWDKMYLLTLMALVTGCRKGELLNLQWQHIDFDSGFALLGTEFVKGRRNTKTGKARKVPLTDNIISELHRFRQVGNHLIFHSTVSEFRPFDISKAWNAVKKEVGLKNFRFHDLRHTAASNYVRHEKDLFKISRLLGHSNQKMTERYSHIDESDLAEMVAAGAGSLK